MDQKQIIWSPQAEHEFKETLDFYIRRNGSVTFSVKLLDEVEELLKLLERNPLIGRLSENKETRVLVKDTFLIFYELKAEQIEIVSFWDNRQDPQKRIDVK